jgi:outer membrane receptor protein involved in Fe transport
MREQWPERGLQPRSVRPDWCKTHATPCPRVFSPFPCFALPLLSAVAPAQTVPPATTASTSSPAVELPPFVVDVSTDRGYAATETLAGTRMRTSLRDVGASLTVLTPEFLQDLAATSLDKALLYTPSVDSVEGDNVDANRASGQFLRFGTASSIQFAALFQQRRAGCGA